MRYRLFTIISFVLLISKSFAQSEVYVRDSILNLLPHAKQDSNKVKLLLEIGQSYANDSPDKAVDYLQRADALSRQLHYDEGSYHALFALAPVLGEMNKLDECISVSEKALAISKKVHQQTGIATAYFDIAGAYAQKGMYEQALNYYLQADTALKDLHDTLRQSINYSKIAGAYAHTDQYRKSYEYGMKAISLGTAAGMDQAIVSGLLTTADALSEMGRYDSALALYGQARELYRKHHDDYDMITVLVNMNHVLAMTGKYDQMLPNADTVLQLSEKVHRADGMCEGNIEKGKYYFFKKNFQQAKKYALTALDLALTREHPTTLVECYHLLANASLGAGNVSEYAAYNHLEDSVHNMLLSDRIVRNTQELQTKYDVAEKEHRIALQQALLEQAKLEKTILIVGLLLISVVLFLGQRVYKNRRRLMLSDQELQQQKIRQLETEHQLLATRSVVKGQEEERSRLAKDLHDGLGGILSSAKYSLSNMKENLIITPENATAFEQTMNMLNLSISEMRRVAHNMMPESLMKLKLNEALQDYCEQVTVSGAIDIDYQSMGMDDLELNDTYKITVYRVVQELINNVIKHAEASAVIVQIFTKDGLLYLTVEDNGKGFEKDKLLFSQGIGFRNIKNRIDYLKGSLDMQSAPGKGTSVYIEIQLQ